jgi:hypothetical protein
VTKVTRDREAVPIRELPNGGVTPVHRVVAIFHNRWPHNLGRAAAVGGGRDDFGAPDMVLRRVAVAEDRVKPTTIFRHDVDECSHDESLNCFGQFGNRPNESDHQLPLDFFRCKPGRTISVPPWFTSMSLARRGASRSGKWPEMP